MGIDKLLQVTGQRIFQTQIKKERFSGKSFLTVPDSAMNEINSLLLDRPDRSAIQE